MGKSHLQEVEHQSVSLSGLIMVALLTYTLLAALFTSSSRPDSIRTVSGAAIDNNSCIAWIYDGGPPPQFELDGLDVLPGNLLLAKFVIIAGDIYVFDANSGTLLWQRDLGSRSVGSPTVFMGKDDLLYTVGYPKGNPNLEPPHVLALEPRTGRLVWKTPLRSKKLTRLDWKFSNGRLFAFDDYFWNELTAVDLATRRVIWNYECPTDEPERSFIFDMAVGSRLVALLLDGPTPSICLLDKDSGREMRTEPIGDMLSRELAVAGSAVYVPSVDRRSVRALSLESGKVLWQFALEGIERIYALHVLALSKGDALLVRTSSPTPATGNIHLIDVKTGQRLWALPTKTLGQYAWRLFEGEVLIGIGENHLVAVSRKTGKILWRRSLASIAPEFADGSPADFVPGAYGNVVILRFREWHPSRTLIAVLNPSSGETLALHLNPAGVTEVQPRVTVADGRKLYLYSMERRRLVALNLPSPSN